MHKIKCFLQDLHFYPYDNDKNLLTFALRLFIIIINILREIHCEVLTLKEHGAQVGQRPTDEELIGRFLRGDDTAFELIASRYLGLISTAASRWRGLSPDMDSADLIQEGMLALLYACRSYDAHGGSSFKNYLMLCYENRLRSIQRHIAKKGSVPAHSIVSIDNEDDSAFDPTLCSPDELVETKEYIGQLHRILKDRLSDLEYKVAILHLSGYSYREIADKLDTSLKTIDNAHTRIRQKLSR